MSQANRSIWSKPMAQPHTIYPSAHLLLTLAILWALSSPSFVLLAKAQSFTPSVVSGAAFARTVNKLYVLGGTWSSGPDVKISQFMYLDLSVVFSSTAPAWNKLASGPAQNVFPVAFSSDEQTLYVFRVDNTNSPWRYFVKNDTWMELSTVTFQDASIEGISAVTDPQTGLIYLAGGYRKDSLDAPAMKYMEIFDPITETLHTVDLPPPEKVFAIRWYAGNVWSRYRNSILYWGGNNRIQTSPPSPVENAVTELSTDSMTWYSFLTQGPSPPVKADHCIAANEDGTKVAIYGGRQRNNTACGELWVLDVVTHTWTQGLSGPSRMYAVCTIAGDQFLIWGGRTSLTDMATSEMLIYNLTSATYVKQYAPPSFYRNLQPPPPISRTKAPWDTTGSGPTKDGLPVSIGAIAGGVTGALALMGGTVGFFLLRQKQRRQQQQDRGKDQDGDGNDKNTNPSGEQTVGGLRLRNTSDGGEGAHRRNGLGAGTGPWRDPHGSAAIAGAIKNDPHSPIHDYADVNRTLQDLVQQQQELELRRQLLVLQQYGLPSGTSLTSSPIRGPSVYAATTSNYHPPPLTGSPPLSSTRFDGTASLHSDTISTGVLSNGRTVQAVSGSLVMDGDYGSDGYVDGYDGSRFGPPVRRASDLEQDSAEPIYRPSPAGAVATGSGSNTYPDVVYMVSPDVGGMNWARQQHGNHPHTCADPYVLQRDDGCQKK